MARVGVAGDKACGGVKELVIDGASRLNADKDALVVEVVVVKRGVDEDWPWGERDQQAWKIEGHACRVPAIA